MYAIKKVNPTARHPLLYIRTVDTETGDYSVSSDVIYAFTESLENIMYLRDKLVANIKSIGSSEIKDRFEIIEVNISIKDVPEKTIKRHSKLIELRKVKEDIKTFKLSINGLENTKKELEKELGLISEEENEGLRLLESLKLNYERIDAYQAGTEIKEKYSSEAEDNYEALKKLLENT